MLCLFAEKYGSFQLGLPFPEEAVIALQCPVSERPAGQEVGANRTTPTAATIKHISSPTTVSCAAGTFNLQPLKFTAFLELDVRLPTLSPKKW